MENSDEQLPFSPPNPNNAEEDDEIDTTIPDSDLFDDDLFDDEDGDL